MTPLVHIDRMACARPVLGKARVSPCGERATVVAPEETGFLWAYCPRHARQEAALLEAEIRVDLAAGKLAADARQKLDALHIALEIS